MPIGELLTQQSFYWTVVGAGYVIRNLIQLQEQERETARLALEKSQLESSLRAAELQALRMRLNPHFLFNTLQNISTLVQHEPKTASQMLARLGDILRIALGRELQSEVTLHDEIALTRAYLDIEKMRFRDKLSLQIDVAAEAEQALVPSLLLQPIVENAIKHGLRGTPHGGEIAIRCSKENDRLVLKVRDNGVGFEEAARLEVGIGLGSTQQRLERMYPGQFEFVLRNRGGRGTEVQVSFPFQVKPQPKASHDEQPAIASC
jgi:two-component system, LytTR family, sensor kinase